MAEEGEYSKILKVTVEYEGATFIAEGKDAEKWQLWVAFCERLAEAHGHEQVFNWTKIEEVNQSPKG